MNETPLEESPVEEPEVKETVGGKRGKDVAAVASDMATKMKDALEQALSGRANVLMIRVNDETLKYLDMLVEADICKSRSESAAFLITEGIKANESLFERIGAVTEQIIALRTQLREMVRLDASAAGDAAS
ncbi:MAG: hypothetical protein SVX38_15820 [Chloroflexota bacterium]|nr:hypothetical protein [Chloroflexota bacterium]